MAASKSLVPDKADCGEAVVNFNHSISVIHISKRIFQIFGYPIDVILHHADFDFSGLQRFGSVKEMI